ncbi:MAG TPA: hypothetical protein VJA65_03145 [bacterium]|nr:hypothetical protein [bacterium]
MGDILHYAVSGAFGAGTRIAFALHSDGLGHYRQGPSTLVVVNHRRDSDSIIVPPLLIFNGVRPIRPMWFAGREDMFCTGFLGLQAPFPDALRRLLVHTNLTRVLHALHILPIRRFPERTRREAVEEFISALADPPAEQVLAPREVEVLAALGLRGGKVSDILGWRYRRWWWEQTSLRVFLPQWRDRVAGTQRAAVDGQLRALAAVLDRGDALYVAPEGVLSSDGRLQPFRAGFRRVLELVRVPVRYLPVGIVYDFMTRGRMRAFVAVGGETPVIASPAVIETEARRAVAALQTMTVSQVASTVLWETAGRGEDTMAVAALAAAVFERAAALRDRGIRIDPALFGRSRMERIAGYVGYLTRRGIALANGAEMLVDLPYLRRVPAVDRQNPVRYAVNELESVLAILSPAAESP